MRMRRRALLALCCLTLAAAPYQAAAQAVVAQVEPRQAMVFVAGRSVAFEHLGTSRGQPVVGVDDRGLAQMLNIVGAKMQFQPGTRFVVFTRADGALITFTVGSNAVSIDDLSTALTVGPFYQGGRLYVPLSGLARGLGLFMRAFRGGYALGPQITSVQRKIGQRRTIVEIQGSAPLVWRATLGGPPKQPTVTVSFPGFANAAGRQVDLGRREGTVAQLTQQGPPGYPITTLSFRIMHGVKFAAHRAGAVTTLDLVLARDSRALALAAVAAAPSGRISAAPQPTIAPPTPTPVPVPTAVPAPEVTDNGASPSPSGVMPGPQPSQSPGTQAIASPSPVPLEKITDVSVSETADTSRIALSVTGPVSFEWHRLAPPDNRFWVDISQAALVGPARDIALKLAVVQSVKISQHELMPDHVVRLIIDPSQPVDVAIGAIVGAPGQLGIDIHASAPPSDAPSSGVGMLAPQSQSPQPPVAVTPGPTRPNLIVIDPGHGGNDPGALNPQYGLVESHLTLAISLRLKAALERAGWRVVLTRDGDYEVGDPNGNDFQELQARCDVANAAGARLFISVHINSSESSQPSGLTTYFWRPADRDVARAIQNATVRASGAGDDGIKRDNFYVIHHTVMAAVLVEGDYLSNAHDAAQLTQEWFLDKLAAGIAQGVKDYTGGPPPS